MITVNRTPIAQEVTSRLVEDIQGSESWRTYSKRLYVVDELGKFLDLCSATQSGSWPNPVPLRPAPIVDRAWHAFILRTEAYAEHCESLGVFVHHTPDDVELNRLEARRGVELTFTALGEAGLEPLESVWLDESYAPGCSACGA